MTTETEPRYTLTEAKRRLAEMECVDHGHLLRESRQLDGTTLIVFCDRCGVTFDPPLLPPLPPSGELRQDVFQAGSGDPGSVRLVHIPTGTVAAGGGGQSQAENLLRAEQILRARLYIHSLGGGGPQPTEPRLPELPNDTVRYDMVSDGTGLTGGYAVKVTHIPTGVVAEASAGRSDQQKRSAATSLLRARLLVAQLEREANGVEFRNSA
jgi:hypothetical protein